MRPTAGSVNWPSLMTLGAEPPSNIPKAPGFLLWRQQVQALLYSPALWRDEGVTHVQDAHIWVAFHVLLPVDIVVLHDVCRREHSSQGRAAAGAGQPFRLGHVPIIFFTISYMACSSSSSFRHRYFSRIRSPHKKAKPVGNRTQLSWRLGCHVLSIC